MQPLEYDEKFIAALRGYANAIGLPLRVGVGKLFYQFSTHRVSPDTEKRLYNPEFRFA